MSGGVFSVFSLEFLASSLESSHLPSVNRPSASGHHTSDAIFVLPFAIAADHYRNRTKETRKHQGCIPHPAIHDRPELQKPTELDRPYTNKIHQPTQQRSIVHNTTRTPVHQKLPTKISHREHQTKIPRIPAISLSALGGHSKTHTRIPRDKELEQTTSATMARP